MSLLDRFPHRCTIVKKTRTRGELGGVKDSEETVSTGVVCWDQPAGTKETEEYQKRGYTNLRKIYFTSNPNVNERNSIQITSRDQGATSINNPQSLDVIGESIPDATAGLGKAYKVMTGQRSQENEGT